jgi:hypothetical protein
MARKSIHALEGRILGPRADSIDIFALEEHNILKRVSRV